MPLPNAKVIHSFFEAYINIRKEDWQLDTNHNGVGEIKWPDNATAARKLNTCLDLLSDILAAKDYSDWIKLVYTLHKIDEEEMAAYNNRYLVVRGLTNYPLIADLARATRSYILSEIKTDEKFLSEVATLKRQKNTHEKDVSHGKDHQKPQEYIDQHQKLLDDTNKELSARDELCDDKGDKIDPITEYYITFYQAKILKKDAHAKILDEKKFADFKDNAGTRRLTSVSDALLKARKQNAGITPAQPQELPTLPANNKADASSNIEPTSIVTEPVKAAEPVKKENKKYEAFYRPRSARKDKDRDRERDSTYRY